MHLTTTTASLLVLTTLLSTTLAQRSSTAFPSLKTGGDASTSAPSASAKPGTSASSTTAQASTVRITASIETSANTNVAPTISTTSQVIISITGVDGSVSTTAVAGAPPKLPTTGIPAVTVTVPPTLNAPFMQHSNLPEGTVFIVVGAILAFFAFVVIAWRAIIAWSFRRRAHNVADAKHLLGRSQPGPSSTIMGGTKGFYNAAAGSSLSLNHLGNSHTGNTPNTSLFFSPTAGAGNHNSLSNRGSAYLPAGFYQAPVTGDDLAPLQPPGTPGGSPLLRPTSRSGSPRASRGSLPLSSRQAGLGVERERTPSTYLEDLLDQPTASDPFYGNAGSQGTQQQQSGSGRSRGSGYGARPL